MSDDSAERPGAPEADAPPPAPSGPAEASPAGSGATSRGALPPVASDVAPVITPARSPRPTAAARGRWTDERIEAWIGTLLRVGVIIAAVVAAFGAVIYMFRYGAQRADYHTFHGVPAGLDSVQGVLAGALLGARVLTGARTATLRRLFNLVLVVIALEMLYKGFTGGI